MALHHIRAPFLLKFLMVIMMTCKACISKGLAPSIFPGHVYNGRFLHGLMQGLMSSQLVKYKFLLKVIGIYTTGTEAL